MEEEKDRRNGYYFIVHFFYAVNFVTNLFSPFTLKIEK